MFRFRLTRQSLVSASAVVFLLLVLSSGAFRNSFLHVIRHPLSVFTFLRRETSALVFFHRNFIQRERLGNEADELRRELLQTEEIRLENERLRSMLDFRSASSYRLIAARVIGRSADSWASTLMIDRGRGHGVRKGMGVITPVGLIGRVIDVGPSMSKVLLISDPDLGVSGIVERTRHEGLVCGTLGNRLIMKYLPTDADIQAGDMVITSGVTSVYPKGIPIGKVIEVDKQLSGLSLYVILQPAVNAGTVEEVFLVDQ